MPLAKPDKSMFIRNDFRPDSSQVPKFRPETRQALKMLTDLVGKVLG